VNPLQGISDLSMIDGRLRGVQRICAGFIAFNLVLLGLSWMAAQASRSRPQFRLGDNVPVMLAMVAAAFILLSSRFRSSILRRAIPRSAQLRPTLEGLLAAYRTATLVSFALLACAALLGPPVALVSGRADYGMIVCVASSFAMLTRWPKSVEVDRLLRGRATP
jgi:xanthine/uracil permease